MEKLRCTLDGGGTPSYHTVFVDTSLDTHMALIVSHSDTVADLKQKIMDEHTLCFPDVGEIDIHALKVKRRGCYYHLSDSLFVRSAFYGVCKSWFLKVDASSVGKPRQRPHSQKSTNSMSAPDLNSQELEDPLRHTDYVEDRPKTVINDAQVNVSIDGSSINGYVEDKRHKSKKRSRSDVDNHALEQEGASARVFEKDASRQDDVVPNKSLLNQERSREVADKMESGSKDISDKPNRIPTSDSEMNQNHGIQKFGVLSEGTAVPRKHIEHENCNSENLMLKNQRDMSMDKEEEASSGPAVKKNKMTVRKDDNQNFSKDDGVLKCSIKETFSPGIISQSSLGDNPKDRNANMDHISTEISKVDRLLTTSPHSVKKKKRKSSKSVSQAVATIVSFAEANGRESTLDTAGLSNNLDREGASVVPEQIVPDAMASEPSFITMKEQPRDVSSENLKADHLLTTSPQTSKKKRKKKSFKSASQAEAIIPSFAKADGGESSLDTVGFCKYLDGERDAAVVPAQNFQDGRAFEPSSTNMKEHLQVPVQKQEENNRKTSSCDGDFSATDAENVKIKDNSTLTSVSAFPRVCVPDDQHVVPTEGNCSPSEVFRNQSVLVNDGQKLGNRHIPSVAEERELSKNNESNAKPSATGPVSDRVEIDMNPQVLVVTADPNDEKGKVEPGKSSKKRKSKLARSTVASGTEHTVSDVVGSSSFKPHKRALTDHSSNESREKERVMSRVVEKESETAMNNILATDRETENVILNVLESLQEISKDAENKDDKSRKKTKRKRNSAARKLTELQTEDTDVSCKNATPSINDNIDSDMDASSKLSMKTKLMRISAEHHQLNGSKWEPKNNAAVEMNAEGINERKPIQVVNGNSLKSRSADDNCHVDVSCGSGRTTVHDNFVSSGHHREIVESDEKLVDKVNKTKGADDKVKAGKKKVDVHSNASHILHSSLKLSENQGNEGEAIYNKRSLSKSNGDSSKLHAKRKLSEPDAAKKVYPASSGMRACSNNRESVAASSSSLGSSKNLLPRSKKGNGRQSHVEKKIVSRNDDKGEVLDISKPKKSLLAKSGTIFKDDSEDSSDDEDGVDNLDSSTKALSDNSLSSYCSDGDSTAKQNGYFSSQRKESAKNLRTPKSSVELHTIMRRSVRYKASKLTASQLQLEDPESEPLECVPDSQI